MITLTDQAIKKIKEIAQEENYDKVLVRVKTIGGGCNGFEFDFYFEGMDPEENDEVFEQEGITILVDQLSHLYLDGTEIDYVDKGLLGSGFSFNSPAVKSTCACGKSVTF